MSYQMELPIELGFPSLETANRVGKGARFCPQLGLAKVTTQLPSWL